MLGVASQVAGNFVYFVLIANIFGPDRFGYYLFSYSIANFLILFVDYGYSQRILREAVNYRQHGVQDCSAGLMFKLLALALMVLVVLLTSLFVPVDKFFYILLAGFVLGSFGDYFGSFIRAAGRHLTDSINLFVATSILVLGVLLLPFEINEIHAAIIFFAAKAAYCALSFWIGRPVRILTNLSGKPLLAIATAELKKGFVYFLDVSVIRMYGVLDTILIRLLLGDGIVGLYQSGQRMLQGFFPMVQVLNNVFLPLLAANGPEARSIYFPKVFSALNIGLAICCLAFFLWVAPILLPLLFGNDFIGITPFLWMFGMYGALRILSAGLAIYLTAIGGQVDRAKANIIALLVLIVCICFLGGLFELAGVIASLSISNSILLILYFVSILNFRRRYADHKESP